MAPRIFLCLLATAITSFSDARAAPGDTLYSEDFQDGSTGGWSVAGGGGTLSVGEYAPGSGELALTACCDDLDVRSPAIDTDFAGAQLAIRVQRGGANIGSDDPDNNEDLDLYFLTSGGSWQFMARYNGSGTPSETLHDSFTLTGNLLHDGFRVRLQQRNGNPNTDYWHLHDISVIEAGSSGSIGNLCDDFSEGMGRWTVNSFGGTASVTTDTANSFSHSLAIFNGSARLESLPLDLEDATAATLTLWVRRGADIFSEDPDGGEDLAIGFINDDGTHQALQTLPGGGTPGQAYELSFDLPAAAFHDAFRVRLERYGDGAGGYWHVDDVCVEIERTLDHFAIRHDGSGINCQPEAIEIIAHDANHFVVENHVGAISLSTDTGNGDWSLLDGSGAVSNIGNGSGGYTYVGADKGKAVLGLYDTFIETVNIGVAGSGFSEAVTEDGSIAFAASGFSFLVNGSAGPLDMQIAGKPSDIAPNAASIELMAIRTSDETGACEAAFTGNTSIDFAFSCENPAICHGGLLHVNGTAIAANAAGTPGVFTSVGVNFGDPEDSTAPLVLQYSDVGMVRLHARRLLDPSGEMMLGATSHFVFRPFGFDVVAVGNPAATDVSGEPYTNAGSGFEVGVRAVAWQASDDLDRDGIPDGHADTDTSNNAGLSDNAVLPGFGTEDDPEVLSLAATLSAPVPGADPGLSGDTTISAFEAGIASTTVSFKEVGVVELAASLSDNDYLGSGPVESRSGTVGRFTPAWFDLEIGSHGCNDTVGFTYSAQPLRLLTVTAKNAAGMTVTNFDGNLGFATDVSISEVYGIPGTIMNGGISSLDFASGKVTVDTSSAGIGFIFASPETAPAIVKFRATDADGIDSWNHLEPETEIRSARLAIADTQAFVIADAVVAMTVESFAGSSWNHESEDACSRVDPTRFSLSSHTDNLEPGESVVDAAPASTFLANGVGQVILTSPGTGNEGSVQLDYDADDWLEFDWNGSGTEDPAATVRFFDVFETEPGLIERHEVF